ncbi:MAG: hypothetical protein JW882_11335 [Deltaproteobacteria bacterium]|nr:hypothetical protein [Deltaproteobacteria bacterium]
MPEHASPVKGMFLLIDRKSDEGLSRWVEELYNRKMPALIMADGHTVNKNPDLIKSISDRYFDVGCIYNDGPFWSHIHEDMITWLPQWVHIEKPHLKEPYEVQYEIMTQINEKITPLIGGIMRAFSGKYFSYNQNTQEIADLLKIPFILARGTAGARAVFYKPEEYRAAIISVSNVPSQQLGTGSLCDESLKARGEKPDGLRKLLFSLEVDRVILVAQSHISGLMQEWWDVYMDYFDQVDVQWHTLNDFVTIPPAIPNEEIPMNFRVDYMRLNPEEEVSDIV